MYEDCIPIGILVGHPELVHPGKVSTLSPQVRRCRAATTMSAQALSSATGSLDAAMPMSATSGMSLCPQQSQSGDTSMMKLMWKEGLSFMSARRIGNLSAECSPPSARTRPWRSRTRQSPRTVRIRCISDCQCAPSCLLQVNGVVAQYLSHMLQPVQFCSNIFGGFRSGERVFRPQKRIPFPGS